MAKPIETQLVITAKDQTGAVLDAVARKLDAVGKKAAAVDRAARQMTRASNAASAVDGRTARSGVLSRAGGALDRAATASSSRLLGAAGALAGGLAVRESLTRYAEVERRMTRIGITADATRAEMRALTAEAQRMAIDMALPFDKIADGFEALAAQGKNLAQMRGMMPAIARTAQASGADVADIAKSAGALSDHMSIAPSDMQRAFDVLVGGGKAGQFELKDMARYLPELGPQAAAVGLRGLAGVRDLVAFAQTVRRGSGSSEEAASSMSNIFAKMESEETAKRFSKMGVDLRKEMAQARKEGKNLLDVFLQLCDKALKGDLSKLPQLFSDMEFARGMRALMSLPGYLKQVRAELQNVDGSTMKDFNRVLEDSKAKTDRLAASWDKLKTTIGATINDLGGSGGMNWISNSLQTGLDDLDRLKSGETTNAFQNYRTAWNWLSTGQGVNQPTASLVQPHADKEFRDRYQGRVDELAQRVEFWQAKNDEAGLRGPGRYTSEVVRAKLKLDDLRGAMSAHDETALQLAELQGRRARISGARINNPGQLGGITPGLLSFGLGGYPAGAGTFGPVPTATKARAEAAAAKPPSLEKIEDIFTSGKIKADVEGKAEITIRLEPTGALANLVNRVDRMEQMVLSNGPGSRGGGQSGAVPGRLGSN